VWDPGRFNLSGYSYQRQPSIPCKDRSRQTGLPKLVTGWAARSVSPRFPVTIPFTSETSRMGLVGNPSIYNFPSHRLLITHRLFDGVETCGVVTLIPLLENIIRRIR